MEMGELVGLCNVLCNLSIILFLVLIWNVMFDLEYMGLLYVLYISVGCLLMEIGFRFFVDVFLEVGDFS